MLHRSASSRAACAGFGLTELLVAIVVGTVVIALIVILIGRLTSIDSSISADTLTVSPATSTVAYGGTGTFTVSVGFRDVYDRTKDTPFTLFIYEDELTCCDTLLDSTVVVVVKQLQTSGTVDFTLDCDAIGRLKGSSGSKYQRVADYDVYAVLQPIPNGVVARTSDNVEVECRKEE